MVTYKQQIWIMCLLLLYGGIVHGQKNIKWWNPEDSNFEVMEGQGWSRDLEYFYDRLPENLEERVREPLWGLSKDAAGLKIKFRSNAKTIYVRYEVGKRLNMFHMPSTGVSGLDLYSVDEDGKWDWAAGKAEFGDTIQYHFSSLPDNYTREYHLYLPLYNQVKWLEIGISREGDFEPLPSTVDKPLVVYGTSIAQGATASRPGRAWTAILERKIGHPLINLAFSGNGRLEKPIVQSLTDLDPKMYIIDCMPNMGRFDKDTIAERLQYTIKTLRKKKPDIPILTVEHAGASIQALNEESKKNYQKLNKIADSIFVSLKKEGVQGIYLLTSDEINLDIESTVDGVHPNDFGMELYAKAYEKKVREILNESKGQYTTTRPAKQYRNKNYDWDERHKQVLQENKKTPPQIVFLGNSITHYWGGKPKDSENQIGQESWDKYFPAEGVKNFGFGWDRIENVLWRVYHGELDGYNANRVIIHIGTNNLAINSDKEILAGLKTLIQAVKTRQPKASVSVLGIYPRKDFEERIKKINDKIAILAAEENVFFADPGRQLLDKVGKVNRFYFQEDQLHPNTKGYEVLGKALKAILM